MFQFFKWTVRLDAPKTGFFVEPTLPGYLCRFAASDNGAVPLFGPVPVLYSFRYASFLVSELRRVGYYARLYPNAFIVIQGLIKVWKLRRAARRSAKSSWKK